MGGVVPDPSVDDVDVEHVVGLESFLSLTFTAGRYLIVKPGGELVWLDMFTTIDINTGASLYLEPGGTFNTVGLMANALNVSGYAHLAGTIETPFRELEITVTGGTMVLANGLVWTGAWTYLCAELDGLIVIEPGAYIEGPLINVSRGGQLRVHRTESIGAYSGVDAIDWGALYGLPDYGRRSV